MPNIQHHFNPSAKSSDTQIPAEIRSYLEIIMVENGAKFADDMLAENMMKELSVRLNEFIATMVAERLSDKEANEFIALLEEGKSQQEVEAYIQQHIPNAQEFMMEALATFRDLYTGRVKVEEEAEDSEKQMDKPN